MEVELRLVVASPQGNGRFSRFEEDDEVALDCFENANPQWVRHLFKLATLDFKLPDGIVLAKHVLRCGGNSGLLLANDLVGELEETEWAELGAYLLDILFLVFHAQ